MAEKKRYYKFKDGEPYKSLRRKDADDIKAFAPSHTMKEIADMFFDGRRHTALMWCLNNGVDYIRMECNGKPSSR